MGYYSAIEKTYLPSKNRVGGFDPTCITYAGESSLQVVEVHQENEGRGTTLVSGVTYYGYRYYNPSTGRFLSKDPIAESGGPNLYAFVNNDPVNRWDMLGLIGFDVKYVSFSTSGNETDVTSEDDIFIDTTGTSNHGKFQHPPQYTAVKFGSLVRDSGGYLSACLIKLPLQIIVDSRDAITRPGTVVSYIGHQKTLSDGLSNNLPGDIVKAHELGHARAFLEAFPIDVVKQDLEMSLQTLRTKKEETLKRTIDHRLILLIRSKKDLYYKKSISYSNKAVIDGMRGKPGFIEVTDHSASLVNYEWIYKP